MTVRREEGRRGRREEESGRLLFDDRLGMMLINLVNTESLEFAHNLTNFKAIYVCN